MAADDRTFPSVWARPRRQERSTLTREQIVTQALRLLDAEGIDALSMRKLAAKLDVGATSLYWHVANRDELIELVVDAVYGELELPEPGGPGEADAWRGGIRRYAYSVRATVGRHPWVASVLDQLVAGYLGPNLTRVTEQLLAVLEAGGLELGEAERTIGAVSSYVLGVALAEAAWRNWLDRHGQTVDEWAVAAQQVADETAAGHERLQKVIAGYEGVDVQKAMDDDFAYGLDRMLDGIQAHIDRGA